MSTRSVAIKIEHQQVVFEPETLGFHSGDILEFALTAGVCESVRFASSDPWVPVTPEAASSFAVERHTDGRALIVRCLGPDVPKPRSIAYHVRLEEKGDVFLSDGYPTVNQHPPVGGGGDG